MFLEFTTKDNKMVLLNTDHIISVEFVFRGTPGIGGGSEMRIYALEQRAFTLDSRRYKIEEIHKQIKELGKLVALPENTDGSNKDLSR